MLFIPFELQQISTGRIHSSIFFRNNVAVVHYCFGATVPAYFPIESTKLVMGSFRKFCSIGTDAAIGGRSS